MTRGTNSDSPKPSSTRRLLFAFSIAEDEAGERLPVIASFPDHVDDLAGIAALIEAAAVKAGVEFAALHKAIGTRAPPPVGAIECRDRTAPAHRPSYDWLEIYGQPAAKLEFRASFYQMLHRVMRPAAPAMAKARARRMSLAKARAKLRAQNGARHLSDARIIEDAERLKQAFR